MSVRRWFHAFAAALLIVTAAPRAGFTAGTDVDKAAKILASADDYRLRLGAALTLGNSGDPKARKPLEGALIDPHPSVRQAAASALAKLGDALAIPALEQQAKKEPNVPTKAAMQKAAADLKANGSTIGTTSGGGSSGGGAPDWSKTKYVIKLQKVSNTTGIRGNDLAKVLGASARAKFAGIAGVYVLPDDTTGPAMMATAQQKGLPVLGVDASLASLDQALFAGDLKVQAKVSFAITKLQVVKASIEGNASSIGSTSAAKNPSSLAKLQDMAVDGAVTSAMSKAPTAFKAAATP
jgi:hypothetical protein